MLNSLKQYVNKERLFKQDETIILAVSGGLDSMVMTELFRRLGYRFAVAHCNFKLRGTESDEDEEFVKNYCEKNKIKYFVKHFETKKFASDKGISIQMAARDLRYEWFEYLCLSERFNYYATAHHKDDQIETFFINLLRGTGIAGLHGISPKHGKVVRPLLFAGRDEIKEYAIQNKMEFREDSSNSEVKYLRNNLRHKLLPVLKEINPGYRNILTADIERLRETEKVFRKEIGRMKELTVLAEDDLIKISIPKLKSFDSRKILLFEILSEYGFNYSQVENIDNLLGTAPGKTFYSESYLLLKDRDELIIAKSKQADNEEVRIFPDTSVINHPLLIKLKTIEGTSALKINKKSAFAYLDKDKLKFPLEIRKWNKGDFFYPLGMKNKKKLSDFFIDEKFSIIEKRNSYILTSGSDIVWIIGHRIDDRYKISDVTQSVLLLEVVEQSG